MHRCKIQLTVLFITVFALSRAHARFDESYGKLRPLDIETKECSFEPTASVVILLDEGKTDFNSVGNPITYRHLRMKVLKQEGIELAKFSFTYPGGWDWIQIDQMEAKTINLEEDGAVKEYQVDKKSFYSQKFDKYYKRIAFAFPQVRVGSVLECRYRITNNGGMVNVNDWNFQKEFPVYKSSYYYRSHALTEVSYALQKRAEYPVSITKQGKGDAVLFEMTNIPALTDEPYMDARENYLQKVKFHVTRLDNSTGYRTVNTSWDELAKFYNEQRWFGLFLNTVSRDINVHVASLTKGKSPLDKMRAVHDWVRKNIEYNGDQQKYADFGLVELWHNKKGTSGDINLLLVYMLRSAGLQVDPVLISEAENGRIEKTFTDIHQFSNVYAAVNIDGRRYYLDGTDKETPSHLIQTAILNTTGLLMKGDKAEFITIEEHDSKNKKIITVESFLNDKGEVTGKVRVDSRDYGRLWDVEEYKEHKSDYVEQALLKGNTSYSIDSFNIANLEDDSLPLVKTFSFKTNLQHSGDYDFVSLNMFSGFKSNPFMAETRISDVNFGYKTSYTITNVLNLPPGKKIDAAPKNIQLVNNDKTLSFSRQVVYSEQLNQLVTRMKIEINKSLFKADQYADLKEFYKKLNNLLEEQCVITNR